ncbi:MAG TPA: toprim domain-containing protein [Candidatus Paceibacterota bacterium]|nr:toprim domain-containing protein [Candidatus Paceibacterota bacterium]
MDKKLQHLTELFLKFPGIGERQARRFAYFILSQPLPYVEKLSQSLREVRSHAQTCTQCLRIFEGAGTLCSICGDERRDHGTIAVVEKSHDIDAFARTDYHGTFFVLGGLIPIVQKATLQGTNIITLLDRVKADGESHAIKEIILAFPLTPNGEHTDQVVRETLAPSAAHITITSLGRGLSSGAELEYADTASLNASLKKRE